MEALFVDRKAVQVENLFLDFLKSFRADTDSGGGGPLYYESEVEAMKANESNTVFVDFSHVMTFSDPLQFAISDEYLRFEASLRNACKRFVMEQNPSLIADDSPNKDVNVAFFNLPYCKRELTTAEIGKLVSLTGVITRTSEVRPELL